MNFLKILGALLLFAAAYILPGRAGIIGTDLDASYPLVIEHAAARHAQFGKDIIYTMGPLGYLYQISSGLGGFAWQRVAFACLQAAFSAFICLRLLAGMGMALRILVGGWFVLYPPSHAMLCAGAALLLMERSGDVRLRQWQDWLLPAVCGLVSMIKFTDMMSGLLAMGAVLLLAALRREVWNAIRPLLVFVTTSVAAWVLSGQELQNLPVYFRNSLEIATGFAAMTFTPSQGLLALGIAGVLLLFTGAAVELRGSVLRGETMLRLLPILGCAFLSWKHGYVRADGHVMFFLGMLTGYSRMITLVGGAARQFHAALMILALSISGTGAWLVGVPVTRLIANWPSQTLGKLQWQVVPQSETSAALLSQARLPRIRAAVGDAPIDILNFQQGFAFLNDLNLRPRPVFQSYSAYTEHLAALNLAYYQSSQRPEYVLFRLETVDRRWAWMDDAPLALHLLTDWSTVTREKGFLLMKPLGRQGGEWKPLAEGEMRWGKKIPVPEHAQNALVAVQIESERSVWGKAKRFAFQGSNLNIRVWLSDGSTMSRNLVPEMTRQRMLLSPSLESIDGILAWQTGLLPVPHVTQWSLEPWSGAKSEFANKFRYRLWLWTEAPTADRAALAAPIKPLIYPYLPSIPDVVKPALAAALLEGEEVGQCRAPSRIEISVPKTARGMRGKVRLQRSDGNAQETVVVRVVLLDDSGKELGVREQRLSGNIEDTLELTMDFPPPSVPATTRRLVLEATSQLAKNRALVSWGAISWNQNNE